MARPAIELRPSKPDSTLTSRSLRARTRSSALSTEAPRNDSMNTFDAPKTRNAKKSAATTNGGNGHTGGNGKATTTGLEHRHILAALRAFKRGEFDVKLREDLAGVDGQIAETFNELVEMVRTIKEE